MRAVFREVEYIFDFLVFQFRKFLCSSTHFFAISLLISSGNLFSESGVLYTFKNASPETEKMQIIGYVLGTEKSLGIGEKVFRFGDLDTRKDTIVVKSFGDKEARTGDVVFIVECEGEDSIGTIVGELTINSVINSAFQGKLYRGEGFFRKIEQRNYWVVKRIEGQNRLEAEELFRQGNYFVTKNLPSEAVEKFRSALEMDKLFPEAHLALAKLHLNGGEGYISAGMEFQKAFEKRKYFKEKHDLLLFFEHYIRFQILKSTLEGGKYSEKALLDGLGACKESLALNPKFFNTIYYFSEIEYSLFRMYSSKESNPKNRNEALAHFESGFQKLNTALELKKNTAGLHRLAILYKYEIWKEEVSKPRNNSRIQILNEEIETHGQLYKLYLSSDKFPDNGVLSILDEVSSKSFIR